MQQDRPVAIAADELVKTYPGAVRALDGLSLQVPAGTVFGLLGPNGAGKSTTVKVLTTLSRPDSGRASVAGVDVLTAPDQVRAYIGCVAQRSGVDQEATGRENLHLQGRLHNLSKREVRDRAGELLERFGLTSAADRVARTWSGGMQRKLDLAMGLVHHPRVLFLDEPTTGLDPEARAELWGEITRLATTEGLSILLTTHYLEEADRLADRVAIVDAGRIVTEGSPEQLKADLHGDAIHVELAGDADALAAGALAAGALDRVAGLSEVSIDGRQLHARAESGAAAVPDVLAALDVAGVRAASVTVARPSLDDVYLRHTGRSLSPATTAEVAA
jgi:ABC-2 type transport system ATP-binding protein